MLNLSRQCRSLDVLLTHRLRQLSSRSGVYHSSEHSFLLLLLLLSHPSELSKTAKTHGYDSWVSCLLKMPLSSSCPFYGNVLLKAFPLTLFPLGRTAIIPLVTRSHGNVRLGSDEPAGAADDSDVPAAAMLQARSFGSARGSSRSSVQVRHSRPSCSRPLTRAHRRYRLQP